MLKTLRKLKVEIFRFEKSLSDIENPNHKQHFNNYVFKKELADYTAEGVSIDEIVFADNSDILELIQGKGGLFAMLDNELSVPKATNKTYVAKINKEHGAHKRFTADKASDTITFTLQHFAGKVIYNAEGWMEKNKDDPPPEAVDLMCDSSNPLLQKIGK